MVSLATFSEKHLQNKINETIEEAKSRSRSGDKRGMFPSGNVCFRCCFCGNEKQNVVIGFLVPDLSSLLRNVLDLVESQPFLSHSIFIRVSLRVGALFSMKKKKLYENEMEKIQNVKMTLETQIFHVESSVYNSTTISAMSEGAKTMKKIHAQTGVEKVEDILDEIREEAEFGNELSNAFRQPIDLMDDDDLLAELEGLSCTASVATPTYSLPMPTAPTTKVKLQGKQKDYDDLKRLEQELLA